MERDQDSYYDMSFNTFTRLNFWLWKCDNYQFENDVDNWIKSIRIIYKECRTFIKDDDIGDFDTLLTESEKHYKEYLSYLKNYKTQIKGADFKPPRKIFDTLLKLEIKLRFVLDRKGILMKKEETFSLEDY